jgi:hypothetical protein
MHIPDLIRSYGDIELNDHPLPIIMGGDGFLSFSTLCIEATGPMRSTLQAAMADRLTHQGVHVS